MNSQQKIKDWELGKSLILFWKQNGNKIVFTNGCFDLLHDGHIEYLEKAKSLGDKLVVGINTDDSVRNLKGNDRPIKLLHTRMRIIAALGFVDLVMWFNQDTPLELIEEIVPDVLVKGSDYDKDDIVGATLVNINGGSVETIDFTDGHSTSKIIEKIRNY
jgi:rfaE bifunctional protein nucleotidyltransferase chain/domain